MHLIIVAIALYLAVTTENVHARGGHSSGHGYSSGRHYSGGYSGWRYGYRHFPEKKKGSKPPK